MGMREKKKLSIYVRVVGKYAFFVAFLLISRKPVQGRGTGEK